MKFYSRFLSTTDLHVMFFCLFWFSILFACFIFSFSEYQMLLTTNYFIDLFYFGYFFLIFFSEPHHLTGIKCVTTTVWHIAFGKHAFHTWLFFCSLPFHSFIHCKYETYHPALIHGLRFGSMYSIWILNIQNLAKRPICFVTFCSFYVN